MYKLYIPDTDIYLQPGNIVKLNRFAEEEWEVNVGWFSYGGNKPMNGWYLVSQSDTSRIKPLTLPDLDDIYVIEFVSTIPNPNTGG